MVNSEIIYWAMHSSIDNNIFFIKDIKDVYRSHTNSIIVLSNRQDKEDNTSTKNFEEDRGWNIILKTFLYLIPETQASNQQEPIVGTITRDILWLTKFWRNSFRKFCYQPLKPVIGE